MNQMYRYFLLLVFAISSVIVFAQGQGELENVEIEIVKERKVTLPEAERKFNKIAPFASEPISPPITYSFKPMEIQLPLANLIVRPLKLKKEEAVDVHRGQVSAAYGNFASPFLEAFLTSRKPRQLVGAHALMDIWAKGPVDGRNSGNGVYGISLFANSFGDKIRAGSHLSLNQSHWHFYGYPEGTVTEASDVLQRFNRFSLGGSIASSAPGKTQYTADAAFGYLSDRFDAKESKVDLSATGAFKLKEKKQLNTSFAYQLLSRQDAFVDAKPRNLVTASGSYAFELIEKLTLEAGLTVAYENDTIDKDVHVYPKAIANYAISKKVSAQASLTGGMNSVSLHSLSNENPWLAPNVAIHHTNEALMLAASIKAVAAKNLEASAGMSVASLKNLYFYRNVDVSKFELVYDDGATERANLHASLTYAQAQTTTISLRSDWYSYSVDTLQAAWHRPTYKVTLQASHNFHKKLKISPLLILAGGMKAWEATVNKVVTLDPAIDLSLRIEYFASSKAMLFLQGSNLLSTEYPLYFNYPARGVQVRAGLSWSF